MDIVLEKRIREWTLFGLVAAMAVISNLPEHLLGRIGVEAALLKAVLGVLVVLALFLYVRFFFFLVFILLAAGANIPDQWAETLGLSREVLLGTLIVMVAMSLLNYSAKLLPTGLEPKKRKENPEAVQVLIDAIDRHNLSYVKTLLTMDFDLDAMNEQGVTPPDSSRPARGVQDGPDADKERRFAFHFRTDRARLGSRTAKQLPGGQ